MVKQLDDNQENSARFAAGAPSMEDPIHHILTDLWLGAVHEWLCFVYNCSIRIVNILEFLKEEFYE